MIKTIFNDISIHTSWQQVVKGSKKKQIAKFSIYYPDIYVSGNLCYYGLLLDYFEENRMLLFFHCIFCPKMVILAHFGPISLEQSLYVKK